VPSKEFRLAFEAVWKKDVTHAVVMVDGIPATPTAGFKGGGVEGVDIKDGIWRRSSGFFDPGGGYAQIDSLRRGEVVFVRGKNLYKGQKIEIWVESLTPHNPSGVSVPVETIFKFHFPSPLEDASLPNALAYIEKYLKPFPTRDEAVAAAGRLGAADTKTVKLGQSRGEVEAALGRPDKVVDLGTKVIFVYKDMKVVFVDGKVSDVQ
jgi:hypothetical protein